MPTTKKKELTTELMRRMLGSISFADLENKEMTDAERKDYCATISAAWRYLERDIKKFLQTQLEYSANQADTWERVIFARGTFNGADLLFEQWKKAHEEHLASTKPKEVFDEHKPIGEI